MSNDSKLPNRKSMRLQGWDYSKPGMYFVTMNAQNHSSLFGSVKKGNIELYEMGLIEKILVMA